jgi:hypothetical protein
MPIIEHQQFIKAPAEVCFDLARNVDIHTRPLKQRKELLVG